MSKKEKVKKQHPFWVLFKTEVKLALRGGDMLLFGIVMPIGIMLLIGFISRPDTIRSAFSGVASIGICAAGFMGLPLIFSGLRYEKILKRYKATPVSPVLLLAADFLLETLFALTTGIIITFIALFGFGVHINDYGRYILTFLFSIFSIFSFGVLISAVVPNVKMANIICTLIYFPSLFLSGASVPLSVMPKGLQAFANILPMTQTIKLLENAVLGNPLENDGIRIIIITIAAVLSYVISIRVFKWE